MTYPDKPTGLQSQGFFTEKGKGPDEIRQRLAAIGNQWFNRCQSDRLPMERQWALNLAFYSGNQHVQFKTSQGTGSLDLYVPNAPYYRVRITVNQTRKIVRKEISRLTAQKPNAYVIPASSEDADVFAAQAGEQIWDSTWRRLHFNKVLRKAIFWQATCGVGYVKTGWDYDKIDPEANLKMEPGGYQIPGDISMLSISPYHILVPDLMEEDIEEQPYIIHAQVKSNSWLRNKLGIEGSNTKIDAVDDQLRNALKINNNDKKDTGTILEIWVKPGYLPELPNGGMFTVANNQIVQGWDSWPYEHGQYPFAKIEGIPTGKYYPASIIEDIIPLQRELNRSRSQLIEAKNKMSKPQLLAEKGSVEAAKITSEPGQVIFYNPGLQPPQPLPLQNLPSYVTEEIERLYTDISDLSGQHEVSNGSTPPGVTAATAISFLQEQDESLIAPSYSSIEEAIEKVAGQTLTYVKMFWDEARTVKTVGIDGTFDVQTFKNSDLRGNTDIRVESGSALPTSRAAKQAFLMDLMKMGFIPPQDGLEMMEIGGINKIYEKLQVDKRQAQRENLKMRVVTEEDVQRHQQEWLATVNPEAQKDVDSGMQLDPPLIVPVNTYDNHQLHIEVHNMFRKSQNFESVEPSVKMLFEEHVRQHQEALMGMMQHPLTGMEPSNPNAPDPEAEEDTLDAENQQEDTAEGNPTGPQPMPDLAGEGQPSDTPA